MNKRLIITFFAGTLLYSFIFFTILLQKSKSTPTINKKNQEHLYINTSYNENSHRVIKLDFNNYKEEVLLEKKFDDYPTSTHFEETNQIYFTGKLNDGTHQLLMKNMNENKINKLTKTLNYVDFLQLNKKRKIIYMRALVKSGDRNFHVVTFDIQTGNINVWNDNESDHSVVAFDFLPSLKNVLIVTKSIKEEFNNIAEANEKNISPNPPTHTISLYSESGTFKKEVIKLNSFIKSASLSSDGEHFLLNFKDKLEDTSKIGLYNTSKNKIDLLLEDTTRFYNIREPVFNSDNSGFYFIADNENNPKVYFFNLKDKTTKEIWFKENEQAINLYIIK